MKNSYIHNIITFIGGRTYPIAFSVLYAVIIGMLFYPGILYSDSLDRWNCAIHLANGGINAFTGCNSNDPVIPIFLMAIFYKITGEVGFFSAIQVFFFSLLFFYFVRHFSKNITGNIFSSLVLMLPINQIYSVFNSYDSLFSIFLILIFLVLLNKSNLRIILLPIVFAILVGTRINAIVMLPLVILILFTQRASFSKYWYWLLTATLTVILSIVVLQAPTLLKMHKGKSWLIGTAWEYANLATKTLDDRDIDFLESFGIKPSDLSDGICYRSIYCGKEGIFISKVKSSNNHDIDLIKNYALIARDHPVLFFTEKIKYIKSLMGFDAMPLDNAEIGLSREPLWRDPLEFQSRAKKERWLNRFYNFTMGAGKVFLRPWIIFILLIVLGITLTKYDKKIGFLTTLPLVYYGSFFITSQNHELRYFFPVNYIFMAYLATTMSLFTSILIEKINKLIASKKKGYVMNFFITH
jgi:hypothetical protein